VQARGNASHPGKGFLTRASVPSPPACADVTAATAGSDRRATVQGRTASPTDLQGFFTLRTRIAGIAAITRAPATQSTK